MKTKKQGGFSVVELLITLVVIGVVFTAFLTTFTTIQSINKIATDVQNANTIAFAKIQEYDGKAYGSLPTTTPFNTLTEVEDFTASLPTTLPGTKSAKVYINTYPGGNLKQVVVRILYGDASNQKRIEYADFLQRNGI